MCGVKNCLCPTVGVGSGSSSRDSLAHCEITQMRTRQQDTRKEGRRRLCANDYLWKCSDPWSSSCLSSCPCPSPGPVFILGPQDTTFSPFLHSGPLRAWLQTPFPSLLSPSPPLLHGCLGLIGFLAPVTMGSVGPPHGAPTSASLQLRQHIRCPEWRPIDTPSQHAQRPCPCDQCKSITHTLFLFLFALFILLLFF